MINFETLATRKDLDKVFETLVKRVRGGQKVAGNFLLAKIKDKYPINSKRAFDDIQVRQRQEGELLITEVGAETVGYTNNIEYGRRPSTKIPPLNDISKWLARREDIQNSMSRRFYSKEIEKILVRQDYSELGSKQKGLVFIIARGIAKKGYKGNFLFTNTRDNYLSQAVKKAQEPAIKYINSLS